MFNFQEIADALIAGNAKKVKELTEQGVKENISPKDLLEKGLIAGMSVVGEHFKAGDCYIPDVLISARAMHAGMDILKPLLANSNAQYAGKVVIGTVAGDLHDIGKNLVGMMLEGAGFQVIDLGIDVTPEKFVETSKTENANIVAMSALLTTTMPPMKETIIALQNAGLKDKVKVMIGGAPITQKFADQIGADGFAVDAATAADIAKKLVAH